MTNQEFWVCIKNYEHSNSNGDELICDIMVKNGLGQTVGGYYDEARRPEWNIAIERGSANPSQNFHFLEYYIENRFKPNKRNCPPSYNQLYCPQLLMYIAEVAGLTRKQLLDAYVFLESYEKENGIVNSSKNAKYLPGDVLEEYRRRLCIDQITSIIKEQKQGDLTSIISLVSNLKPEESK